MSYIFQQETVLGDGGYNLKMWYMTVVNKDSLGEHPKSHALLLQYIIVEEKKKYHILRE